MSLTKREVERNKKLASKYKGINYDVKKNLFTVRVRYGKDLSGKPLYVKPIRSYNSIDEAVKCLNLYNERVAEGMGRHKKITFEIIRKELEAERKKLIAECKANPESKTALEGKAVIETLNKQCSALDLLERSSQVLYTKDLRKIETGEIQSVYDKILKIGIDSKREGKKVAVSTINDRFKRLKSIVGDKYGVSSELFRVKVVSEIKKDTNKQLSDDNKVYDMEELRKLYRTATFKAQTTKRHNNVAERTRLLLILLICTGARIGEILNISVEKVISKYDKDGYRYESVDGDKETLKLNGFYYIVINRQRNAYTGGESLAKTPQSNRVIPIFKGLYDEIQEYVQKYNLEGKDKLFFSSYTGKKDVSLSQNRAWDYIKALEESAGVERIEGRAIHKFRDTFITKLETIFGIRENIVRFFVGHIGRKDAHSGYLKLGGDTEALEVASSDFVCAQASYYYSVVNGFNTEKMKQLYESYKALISKYRGVDITTSQLRKEYTDLCLNDSFGENCHYFMKQLGYGKIDDTLESMEYFIHSDEVDEAVRAYRQQPKDFRNENSLQEFVDDWMREFYEREDQRSRKNDEMYGLKLSFYNSKSEYFKEANSLDDFLLDIEDKNSVVYKEFQDFLINLWENGDLES